MESVGRARIAEGDVLEDDAIVKPRQLRRAGLFDDLLHVIEVFENLLRCAQSLLEDVVDAHQALDRLVEHQQGDHEAGEVAGGQWCRL